jgi:hypothetical protein
MLRMKIPAQTNSRRRTILNTLQNRKKWAAVIRTIHQRGVSKNQNTAATLRNKLMTSTSIIENRKPQVRGLWILLIVIGLFHEETFFFGNANDGLCTGIKFQKILLDAVAENHAVFGHLRLQN